MFFLCFQSPNPGKFRPLRTPPYPPSLPPWRDANTQQGKQGRATETAVKRYHIGSTGTSGADPNRHNCDGSGGSTSFPRPSPRKLVRLHFPERLARGRWRLGCDGGVAAPGGERSPLGTGSALGVPGCGEGLSDSSPGSARLAETTRRGDPRICWLWVTAPPLGHPITLAWGNHFLHPHRPHNLVASSPQPGQGLSLPTSLEMAAPSPSVLEDVRFIQSSPKGNRPYPRWPLWGDHFIPFAPPPGDGKQTAPFNQFQAQSLNYFTEDRPAPPHSLGP